MSAPFLGRSVWDGPAFVAIERASAAPLSNTKTATLLIMGLSARTPGSVADLLGSLPAPDRSSYLKSKEQWKILKTHCQVMVCVAVARTWHWGNSEDGDTLSMDTSPTPGICALSPTPVSMSLWDSSDPTCANEKSLRLRQVASGQAARRAPVIATVEYIFNPRREFTINMQIL